MIKIINDKKVNNIIHRTNYFIRLFIRKISNIGINITNSTLQTEMIGVSIGFVMPVKYIEKIIYSNDNIKFS